MAYDFSHDFEVQTELGLAEGTVDVFYNVIDGELFITKASHFIGKLYNEEGDVICDFVTQKHQELGSKLYNKLYNDFVFACNDDYRKNGA